MLNIVAFPFIEGVLFLLPGYLWTQVLWPRSDGPTKCASSVLQGHLLLGLACLLWAQLTHIPCTLEVLILLSAVVSGIGFALHRVLRSSRLVDIDVDRLFRPEDWRLVLFALGIGLLYLIHYDRQLFQFNCVNEASRQLMGISRFGATEGYPFAKNYNVRLGNVALVGPSFVAFSSFGPRWIFALTGGLIAIFSGLLARKLFSRERLVVLTMVLAACNPYILAIPINDENMFGWMLGFAVLLGLSERHVPMVWIGLVIGLLLGVRHVAILVLPGVLLGLYYQRRSPKEWVAGCMVVCLVCGLWALHHTYVFGSPFAFESFHEYHQEYPHKLFGVDFGFRGLLNWPFHSEWIRTPYNPFPTSFQMVFWWFDRFGVLLTVAAGFGLWALRGGALRPLVIITYGAPLWLQLAVLESWMQPNKMGIQLVALPGLIVAMVAGCAWGGRSWKHTASLVATSGALALGLWSGSAVDVAADERVYTLETEVRREISAYRQLERMTVVPYSPIPMFQRIALYSPWDISRKIGDLVFDLTHTESLAPTVRSAPVQRDQCVRVRIDLSRPLLSETGWLEHDSTPLDACNLEAALYRLPTLDWANLEGYVAARYHEPSGVMEIALEFGDIAFAGDWFAQGAEIPAEVERPVVEFTVPIGARIVVTDVVADHFSRYYRWEFAVGADDVTGDFRPRPVFTN